MMCVYIFLDDVVIIISINLLFGLRVFMLLKNIINEKRERKIYMCVMCILIFLYIIFLIIYYIYKCINFYIII